MTVVCIAGMHRSGTSLVARALNVCGLYLGETVDLVPAAPDNPEGFWENSRFLDVNNQVLAAFGGAWDLPPDFPKEWEASRTLFRQKEAALRLIEELGAHGTWGWKDPRNSLTLPFWKRLIPDLKVLVVVRNPMDIWRSLTKRGYSSFAFSMQLTHRYYESLGSDLQKGTAIVTHYDALFVEPEAELRRLAGLLGLRAAPETLEKARGEIRQDLRHAHSTVADLFQSDAQRELIEEYILLCRQAGPNFDPILARELQESLDAGRSQLEVAGGGSAAAAAGGRPAKQGPARASDGELLHLRDLVWRRDVQISQFAQAIQSLTARVEEKDRVIQIQAAEQSSLREQLVERDHSLGALTREVAALTHQMAERNKAVLQQDATNRRLKTRLEQAQSQLTELQAGLAYRLIARYRRVVAHVLPEASIGRRMYDSVLKGVRVVLLEGPKGIYRRIRTRPKVRTAVPATRAAAGQGNTGLHVEAYSEMVAGAVNTTTEDFVPLCTEAYSGSNPAVRAIAFYLPQFHPIPENDKWWGKGFTEWTNVSKAVPQFIGHYQPRLPGELGFYDLRVPEVQRRQIELAKTYGVYGFCIHYYWFNGRRLLEAPLEQFVHTPGNDFPFCLCWANENWTRRWDGQEDDVLIAQEHSSESDDAFIHDIVPYFERENYIRIGGRPLLVVYRVPLMPDPAATTERWRRYCREAGVGEPYLVAAQTFGFVDDPRKYGYDAAVEFPPHNIHTPLINSALQVLNRDFKGYVHHYSDAFHSMAATRQPNYRLFRTVFPGWDNEARKPGRANIFAFSTPEAYREWLVAAGRLAMAAPNPEERLVFINAWNEWGEAAYLEPDRRYGYAYLQATMDALKALDQGTDPREEAGGPRAH